MHEVASELKELAGRDSWPGAVFRVELLYGQYFLTMDGLINRRRTESERMEDLLAFVVDRLPGSWGIVYDRDDAMPDPPGPNAFRARVIARGQIQEHPDPFLSPIRPTIED